MLDKIKKDIEKGNSIWIEAFRNQDADTLSKAFHKNGAVLSAGDKITVGRENIRIMFDNWMKEIGPSVFTINTIDVYNIEDEIYEKGHYTLETENGHRYNGKFVVVWKYGEDGRLYFYRDIGV